MSNHDPLKFASQLSAKLAARSRHVCVFFGAGVGRACGLPDITQLQSKVRDRLPTTERPMFEQLLIGRNLEAVLSRLRRIAALVSGDETVDNLTAPKAKALDTAICQAIVAELKVDVAQLTPMMNLAAWAARAGYRLPVELFTVNYDLLPETAFERLRVPYFDGFVGNLKARFFTELVESAPGAIDAMPSFFVRIWKLHGSVNWAWEGENQIVRLGQPVADGVAAAIYPSDAKYDESRRIPFVVLQDRLRRALNESETLVIITGYSFSDDHLNEMIFDAATRRERSEFVAFCYDPIPVALAERAARTPNLQVATAGEAILGGLRADWSPSDGIPATIWENDEFVLRDFAKLAAYLAKSARAEPDLMGQSNA
jgi:hypothetical protein